jgi:hypothetical protein
MLRCPYTVPLRSTNRRDDEGSRVRLEPANRYRIRIPTASSQNTVSPSGGPLIEVAGLC